MLFEIWRRSIRWGRNGVISICLNSQKNTEVNSASIAWDPRALHRLCAQVTRDGDDADDNLVAFAEKAVEAELQFLLSHCMGLAGYSPLICRKDV
mmetsp:Transcript_23125/g.39533  ORF Transcript_23125/g.39533 Transcript_23125/m.39533 type:complete len:95 (+) Transcript_23125:24-308(+)